MLISFFNPSDLIGCGGDINQSDSFRYGEGVHRGVCRGGTQRGFVEGVCRGGMQRGYVEGVRGGGTRRGYMCNVVCFRPSAMKKSQMQYFDMKVVYSFGIYSRIGN